MSWDGDHVLRVLVVCTANQCRSPMAERLLHRSLHQAGIEASVGSAGFLPGGKPAADGAIAALDRLGLDLSDHRSRAIDRTLLEEADFTITMEGSHVIDIVTSWTDHSDRVLTLRDAVDGAASLATTNLRGPDDVREWARYLHASAGSSVFDWHRDVSDPMGRSRRAFRATAKELDGLLTTVVDALASGTTG